MPFLLALATRLTESFSLADGLRVACARMQSGFVSLE